MRCRLLELGKEPLLRQQDRCGRVFEQECTPLRGIAGIDRNVCRSGFQNAEQGNR